MTAYPSQDSFVRGEISPRLHSRASLDLYKAGLSLCENFITLPHGGLRKRGGTYYVDELPDSYKRGRLIPFIFSDDQAYALVFTENVIRIYAYGALVDLGVTTTYLEDELDEIQTAQAGDIMWIAHKNHKLAKLTRVDHTFWTIEDVDFSDGPFGPVNTDESIRMGISAATGSIVIGTPNDVFDPTMVGTIIRIDLENYDTIDPWEPNASIEQPTVGKRTRYDGNIYQTPSSYNDAAHIVRTGATPPTHTSGTERDGTISEDTASTPPVYYGLEWTFLYKTYGTAIITGVNNPQEVTADVILQFPPELVGMDVSNNWRFMAFRAGRAPTSVAIFEERLMIGQRYSLYGSKTGNFESFETGEKADDSLAFTQAGGGEANDITWLREIDGFLGVGTIGGVRSMSGAGIDEPLTPTSFKNRSSRTVPCAPISPTPAGPKTVYAGKGKKVLVELTVTNQLRFQSEDLGQISEHIPKRGIVQIAFQNYPDPLLWFPLETGELGSFTYQPSQDVRGMHRQRLSGEDVDLGNEWGTVESCTVTPGQNGQDDVWLIVKRTLNGLTRRYIEIMTPPFEYSDIEDAFAVDCGLSYEGVAVGSVTGLDHLNTAVVDVLADGIVYTGLTVSGGGITLPGGATATKWQVGLPFVSSANSLELDVGGRDGSLMGRRKRIAKVILSLFETDLTGLEISSLQRNRWEPVKFPTIAAAPDEAVLFTGNVEVPIDDSWEGQGRIMIRHSNPTPCTIRAMTPAFDNEP